MCLYRHFCRPGIARMALFAALALAATHVGAHTEPGVTDKTEIYRESLWQHLTQALPAEIKTIDIYAENPTLTVVCFRANGNTYRYSLHRN